MTAEEILAAIIALEPEIAKLIGDAEPVAVQLAENALAMLKNLITERTVPVEQAVKDIDAAADAALDARFPK